MVCVNVSSVDLPTLVNIFVSRTTWSLICMYQKCFTMLTCMDFWFVNFRNMFVGWNYFGKGTNCFATLTICTYICKYACARWICILAIQSRFMVLLHCLVLFDFVVGGLCACTLLFFEVSLFVVFA